MTTAEQQTGIELTKDIPYLALTGEIWAVCCEDFGENWLHYNGSAPYQSGFENSQDLKS